MAQSFFFNFFLKAEILPATRRASRICCLFHSMKFQARSVGLRPKLPAFQFL